MLPRRKSVVLSSKYRSLQTNSICFLIYIYLNLDQTVILDENRTCTWTKMKETIRRTNLKVRLSNCILFNTTCLI